MGLAWQQGPLATKSVGQFLVADPLPERLLSAEPLRRRMRVRFGEQWVVDSEDVVLLHEPSHYPVAFFPLDHVGEGVLVPETRTTRHRELGPTTWFSVRAAGKHAERAAWQYTDPPVVPTANGFIERFELHDGTGATHVPERAMRATSKNAVIRRVS